MVTYEGGSQVPIVVCSVMIDNYYDVYKLARFVSIFGIVFHEDYSELKLVTEKRL